MSNFYPVEPFARTPEAGKINFFTLAVRIGNADHGIHVICDERLPNNCKTAAGDRLRRIVIEHVAHERGPGIQKGTLVRPVAGIHVTSEQAVLVAVKPLPPVNFFLKS